MSRWPWQLGMIAANTHNDNNNNKKTKLLQLGGKQMSEHLQDALCDLYWPSSEVLEKMAGLIYQGVISTFFYFSIYSVVETHLTPQKI